MLPATNDDLRTDFETQIETGKTFKLDIERNRCYSSVDEIEALKQAIFLLFNIERYEHLIYDWNIGIELKDLIGKDTRYVASEAPRRIREGLIQDDRINEVDSFEVTINKKTVHISCVVHSIYGDIPVEREVKY